MQNKTGLQYIRDYISYSGFPFTSDQIVKETGICYETVKKYLQEFLAEEFIKQIGKDKGKNVYIYNRYKGRAFKSIAKQKIQTLDDMQEVYRRQMKKMREEWDDLL